MLKEDNSKLDNAFEFSIDDSLLVSRTSGRLVHPASGRTYHLVFAPPKVPGIDDVTGDKLEQRHDDKDESILRKRLDTYHKQTAPVVNYYKKQGILATLDAALKPTQVYTNMRSFINKPPPASCKKQ